VRLQVTNILTRVKTRPTYRPIALVNADYWNKVIPSVLAEAVTRSLLASGELQKSDIGLGRMGLEYSEKY
jgi:hypothetical protein